MAIKRYKPTSAARRFMTVHAYDEITEVKPERGLVEDMRKSGFLQRDGLQKRRCGAAFVDIAAGDDGHSHILSPFFPLPYIMSKKGMCVGKSAFHNGLKRIQNMKHLLQLLRLHLIREASFVNAVLKIPDLFGVGICLRQIDVPRVVL